ncbi:MAG TPA: TetR/AcrR family transcriptional regulator [Solirubrobacteraceae bacterium]
MWQPLGFTRRTSGRPARRCAASPARRTAAQQWRRQGLDGLSIGRLAEATGMPKSSVYVLFGSKEELQLATIDAARESFLREVVEPAIGAAPPGRDRLLALCDGFLDYVERRVFPGGCFFVSTSAELGGRKGRVHDRVAAYQEQWRDLLRQTARETVAEGQLAAGTEPDQLAFELGAILTGTNIVAVLHDDDAVIERARRSVRQRLTA